MSLAVGVSLSFTSIIFLVFAIVTLSERGRFKPFYTPVACTNPNIQVPFGFAAYPAADPPLPSFMYFDNILDFAGFNATSGAGAKPYIVVGIDPSTGHPVTGGPFNMSEVAVPAVAGVHPDLDYQTVLTGPAAMGLLEHPTGGYFMKPPTAAQYAASLPIPHVLSCSNANEYDITIIEAEATIQATLDGVNFVDIGESSMSNVKLASGATGYETNMNIKLNIDKSLGEVLAPMLMAGVVNALPPQTLPMFVSFTKLDTEITSTFLGLSETEKDKLPLKYCGFHIKNNLVTAVQSAPWNLVGYSYFALEPVTSIICENTKADIVTKMFDATFVAAEAVKYAGVAPTTKGYQHVGGGVIANFDPKQETLDASISKLDTMTGIFAALFFLGFAGCLGGGIFYIKKGMNSSEPVHDKDDDEKYNAQ